MTVSLDPMYEEPCSDELGGRTSSEWKNNPVCSEHTAELACIDSDDSLRNSFCCLNSLAFCNRLNLSCSKAMEEFIALALQFSLLILKEKGGKKKPISYTSCFLRASPKSLSGKKQVPRWKGQVELARSKAEFWLLDVKKAEASKERDGLRGRNNSTCAIHNGDFSLKQKNPTIMDEYHSHMAYYSR
ncbi:hypothetical protein SDJN02_13776, partial [Cucurbita argyrosperma subsp. argyrosperma]